MTANVDISINVDELYRRILEGKKKLVEYVKNLSLVYDKANEQLDLPDKSEKMIIDISNSVPIVIYKEPSKEAYRELFSRALLFLKLEYAIYESIETRLGKLKGLGFKAMVRYFSDVPPWW
ncbi:hypothetical protein [Vulcanisaeta souniana]|uniref:hypothetical protein n=1 Tax=Vulcanisaeta souniana TaxID=164452 RepID=UPI000A83EE77|nr:hypothetical protein [Vulcanisaeta souniana]